MYLNKELYFELEEFKKFNLKAIYTTKTLGDVKSENDRKKIENELKISNKKIYSGFQTHSANIVVIEDDTLEYSEDTDGFLTDRKDVVIFTKYADCLPIYFYCKKTEAFGCVHSGWMGSFKKIAQKAVEILQNRYQSKLEDIVVGLGIGISKENYEVSKDFYEKFKNEFTIEILENVFLYEENKYYFDNQKFNYNLLQKLGIKKENIIQNSLCTYDGNFHSYRRDKNESGRNGAYIFIDNDGK
ncbi:MAG: peptidoglycan editing factor PgeF [Cetobacterium sp.]